MFEHRHELESKVRNEHHHGTDIKVPFYRFVCTCGACTKWRKNLAVARLERDRHALDGQLSHA